MEEEKRKILDQFKEDLAKGKTEALHNVRLTRAEIEEAVLDILPKEHEKSHEDMRKFIEHSPEPKIHGDHHDFTESVRGRLEHLIVAVFKALGGIILMALAIGLYTWVTHQVK